MQYKIAFLLTLYGNPKQANIFINQLLSYPYSYVFIHIDSKNLDIKNMLISSDRVFIISESYDVQWGDYSQIEANLALIRYASRYDKFEYFSVHSGNDIMIKPVSELVDFLKKDKSYAYLDCHKLPHKDYQYGGGLGRIAIKWPTIFRKKYSRWSPYRIIRSSLGRAYELGLIKGKLLPKDITFYGQSDWFTLSNECIKSIDCYLNNNSIFFDIFKDSLIGSEIFFNTLVFLTGKEKKISKNYNLRYIDFENVDAKTPGSPKLLKYEDRYKIINSNCFFARKVDIKDEESKKLIEYLGENYNERINNNSMLL